MDVKVLRRQLLLLAFFDEFVPLYALYILWWETNGISSRTISYVLAVWAGVVLLLEIPSGALADRVDRRRLIAFAYLMRMGAISVWLIFPSVGGAVVGTVMWALHDALASGAWEAMIYDELDRCGEAPSYGALMARLAQAAWLAVALASLTAVPLAAWYGIKGVGWVSVGLLSIAVFLVLRLPGAPPAELNGAGESSYRAWMRTLRQGLDDARRTPVLGKLVVLGALIETLTLFEEYIPLLAYRAGAGIELVPVITGLAWVGFVVGAELAARRPDLDRRVQSGMMLFGAVAALVAIRGAGGPFVVVSLAVLHVSAQTTMILADARLQERAPQATRATISSVRGFLTGVLALLTFMMVGAMDRAGDVRPGLVLLLAAVVASAVLISKWMPRRRYSTAVTPGGE